MKSYELLYIIPSSFTDAEVEEIIKKIETLLNQHSASILRHESLGKIRLAYPIGGHKNGTYVLAHFDVEPAEMAALDGKFKVTSEVTRHLIVERRPGAENARVVIETYQPPLTDEGHRRREERRDQPRPVVSGLSQAPKATEPTMTMEELDKKLDEILEDDALKNL